MKKSKLFVILLCCLCCAVLLCACGKQKTEEPAPTTQSDQGLGGNNLAENETPMITFPLQNPPVDEGIMPEDPEISRDPFPEDLPVEPPQVTQPPVTTEPSQPTTESTEPTEPIEPVVTEPHKLEEDELPPVPLF